MTQTLIRRNHRMWRLTMNCHLSHLCSYLFSIL